MTLLLRAKKKFSSIDFPMAFDSLFVRSSSKDSRAIASKLSLNHSINGIMWSLVEMVRAKVISSLPFNLCSAMSLLTWDPSNVKLSCTKALVLVFYPHTLKSSLTIRTIEFRWVDKIKCFHWLKNIHSKLLIFPCVFNCYIDWQRWNLFASCDWCKKRSVFLE